jgi:hypothetical protein
MKIGEGEALAQGTAFFPLLERGADKALPGGKSSRQLSAKTRTYPIESITID